MSRPRWQHRSRNRSLKAKKMTSRKTAHQETVHAGMAPAVKDEKVDGRVAVTADAWKLALKGVMARAVNPAVAGAVAVVVVVPGEIGAIVKVKVKEMASNVNVLTPTANRW